MIKIAVCDDERYFRERMNKILTEYMEEKGYSYDITGFKSGEEFLYVESRLHKVIFFVMEDGIKEYHMYDKLDNIDKRLTQYNFYRIHQSFLVNMRYVKKVERYRAVLLNEMEIAVSKKYYKSFETEYIRIRGNV